MRKEKGSALITVILVVLVLSMVGIAALVYMSVEERISGNDALQKEALYAAEYGIRTAERVLADQRRVGVPNDQLLQKPALGIATTAATPSVPVFPVSQTTAAYDVQHLGTYLYDLNTGAPIANQAVPYTTSTAAGADNNRAFYSLYVRNNPEDNMGTPTSDTDGIIQLISVGYLIGPDGGALAVKIVGEGFAQPLTHVGNQADLNAGATNAIEGD